MQQLIQQAIVAKKLIEFNYKGHIRIVEPHILGIKNRVVQVLGYQVGGASTSNNIPDWRRFDLPEIRGLRVTETSFPGRRTILLQKHDAWDLKIAVVA